MSEISDLQKLEHVLSLLVVAASLLASTGDTKDYALEAKIFGKADSIVCMLGGGTTTPPFSWEDHS